MNAKVRIHRMQPRLAIAVSMVLAILTLTTTRAKAQAAGTTLGDILDPILDFFECRTGSAEEQLLCRLVRARVNQELAQENIFIDAAGLLFTFDDPTRINIDTGHSCTVTARIERRRASALIGRQATLDFRGNAISEPVLIGIKLPVTLDVRFNVKQSFGVRDPIFGCQGLGSDNYTASGVLNTDAQIAIMFTLAPSLSRSAEGDFIITIRPMVRVASNFERTDVQLNVSGVSPVSGVATALLAGPSTLLKGMFIFNFEELGQLFADSAITDLAVPLLLAPGPLNGPALELAELFALDRAARLTRGLGNELETTLMNGLRRVLRLDGEDKRVFVIRRDFFSIVQASGENADIYLAVPPSNCTFNGRTIAHGASVRAYLNSSAPVCEPCIDEIRACNNGVLSGSYAVETCAPRRLQPGQQCP